MNVNVAPEPALAGAAAPFQVERLGVKLGAEISGVDLREPLPPATLHAFEAALIEYKVIMLRDQHLTTAQHVALSRQFGTSKCIRCGRRANFPKSWCSTTIRTIRCCPPTCGTAIRRFARTPPNTRSCAARSCRNSAA